MPFRFRLFKRPGKFSRAEFNALIKEHRLEIMDAITHGRPCTLIEDRQTFYYENRPQYVETKDALSAECGERKAVPILGLQDKKDR